MQAVPPLYPSPAGSPPTPHTAPRELTVSFKEIKAEPLTHLIPILTDLRVEGKPGENPSVQRLVDEMRAEGQTVDTFPLEWRGKSSDALRQALAPLMLHYSVQALFLRERTRRRVVENNELTSRSNLQVAYQYRTPLKHKLMVYWRKSVLEQQLSELQRRQDAGEPCLQSSFTESDHSFRFNDSSSAGGGVESARSTGFYTKTAPSRRAAPPMLSSRRGSLAAPPGLRAGPGQAAQQHRRFRDLADAQESTAKFETTLSFLLGSSTQPGPESVSANHPSQGGAISDVRPPLQLSASGGSGTTTGRPSADGLAEVFQSAIKNPRPSP